jgi:hypothetical protein
LQCCAVSINKKEVFKILVYFEDHALEYIYALKVPQLGNVILIMR